MASRTIFAGTVNGVMAVSTDGAVRRLGLENCYVNHLSKMHDTLVVACPKLGALHSMRVTNPVVNNNTHPSHQPGLHLLSLPSSDGTKPPASNPADNSMVARTKHIWSGDARSCFVVRDFSQPSPATQMLVGSEPADVFVSGDGGSTWQGSQSFADLPTRARWSFPVTPHQPHVLSIDPGERSDGTPVLIAGIEVGGVLSTSDLGRTWHQHTGVYEDVHSVRSDPFNRRRWLAITGGGMSNKSPIYLTEDGGDTWHGIHPLPAAPKLYVIGQSWNPYRQGEVLLTAGFGPPARGALVMHSTDGGVTFRDVTSNVKVSVPEAAMVSTPVPLWVEGGAVLGMCTGQLVIGEGEGLQNWRVVADLGAKINVLTSDDDAASASAVTH